MSLRVALGASAAVLLLVAACGGKIDGVSTTGGAAGGTPHPGGGVGGRRPGGGGGGIGRPETPITVAAVASDIAEDYCKAFSSCCVASKLLPIDVSRCRAIITGEVTAALAGGPTSFDQESTAECVDTIHERIAACGTSDVNWESIQGAPALFAPESVRDGCAAILKPTDGTKQAACSTSKPCTASGYTCAVDECASNPGLGGDCANQPCLDGFQCNGTTCVTGMNLDVGGACASDDDCMLGMVCAEKACAPAREHPESAKRRYSPYRVGVDTCKSFTYL